MITCTKICRSLGLLANQQDKTCLFGNVDAVVLEKSIVHFDEQVRLDSLALICENPKTTESILHVEFELIKKCIYFNADTMSASYRQTFISSMKKLFFRFKDSWLYQAKLYAKSKSKKAYNKDYDFTEVESLFRKLNDLYKQFINWLFEFLFNSMHLDSTFAKRNQNLNILTQFLDLIGKRCSDEDSLNNNNLDLNSLDY